MFIAMARISSSRSHVGSLLNNAVLESFVIHFRVLFDFFFEDPKADDLSLVHFLEGCVWEKPKDLEIWRRRANKFLAHLTILRAEEKPPIWPVGQIYARMIETIKVFAKEVDITKIKISKNLSELLDQVSHLQVEFDKETRDE